jgi:hypothetical protein
MKFKETKEFIQKHDVELKKRSERKNELSVYIKQGGSAFHQGFFFIITLKCGHPVITYHFFIQSAT